jgi:hypothetical protein
VSLRKGEDGGVWLESRGLLVPIAVIYSILGDYAFRFLKGAWRM